VCILLSGKAGTGKTFIAEKLREKFSMRGAVCAKYSFASSIKKLAKYFGWDGNKDDSGRSLLQFLGKAGREYDKGVFVRLVLEAVEESDDYPLDVLIIDDWRFPDEASFIEKFSPLYTVVKIRLEAPDREILSGECRNDDSEVALDDYSGFDHIYNNSIVNAMTIDMFMTRLVSNIIPA